MKIIIETPKFGFVKRKDNGSIDYISPIPSLFNYGSVPNTEGADGDREDAILLGRRRKFDEVIEADVQGVVKFWDKGEYDPKHILGEKPPIFTERVVLRLFFGVFSLAKKLLNFARRKKGRTAIEEISYRV